MASQALTGKLVTPGVNGANTAVLMCTLTSALTAAQTLTLTLPSGMDDSLYPTSVRAYSAATPALELNGAEANLVITSHNRTTGVTVLTAAAAGIANAAKIIVTYHAA